MCYFWLKFRIFQLILQEDDGSAFFLELPFELAYRCHILSTLFLEICQLGIKSRVPRDCLLQLRARGPPSLMTLALQPIDLRLHELIILRQLFVLLEEYLILPVFGVYLTL